MNEHQAFDEKVASLESRDKALAYLNFGNELRGKGMDPIEPARKALDLFRELEDASGVVQSSIVIANHLFTTGENYGAMKCLLEARDFLETIPRTSDTGHQESKCYLMNKIAFMHFQLKEHAKAIDSYLACVDMFEEIGDAAEIIKVYGALGFIYQDLGENDKANEMFAGAARIARDTGDRTEEAKYTSFIS